MTKEKTIKYYCPTCKHVQDIKIIIKKIGEYRQVKIRAKNKILICSKCLKELHIPEIDNENKENLEYRYRKRTCILDMEELKQFLKDYNITAFELSRIISISSVTMLKCINGYHINKVNSNKILDILSNREIFFKNLQTAHKDNIISQKTYDKIMSKGK